MKLVTFEGIDGAGKTTLIKRLAGGALPATCAPTSDLAAVRGQIGKTTNIAQQYVLAIGARVLARMLIQQCPIPGNGVLLYDRYVHSTLVYQGGDAIPAERIWLDHEALDLPAPDLVILLDLPAEVALARMEGKKQDLIESRGLAYFQRLRQRYLDLAFDDPDRIAIIDATQPPETVLRHAVQIIHDRILDPVDPAIFDCLHHEPTTTGGAA